jgi:hypothetical protein
MTGTTTERRFARRVTVLGALALTGLTWTSPSLATTYGGRALGASTQDSSGLAVFGDTGELPTSGGLLTASAPGIVSSFLLTDAVTASTSGANNVAQSDAAVENVVLLEGQPDAEIRATSVRATTQATCSGATGSAEIFDLTVGGNLVTVTGEPGQTVNVPGFGTLILNDQIVGTVNGVPSLTVNAMRFEMGEPRVTVVVASARSDLGNCTTPPQECADFVTGGGWISLGSSQANFGFNAGFKPNSTTPEIHFNYIDHDTGMHMKATSIDLYVVGSTPTTRHMEGSASVDGQDGLHYSIDVTDNGEPGTADLFGLTLSNGYSAGGVLLGGDIQLHRPCP